MAQIVFGPAKGEIGVIFRSRLDSSVPAEIPPQAPNRPLPENGVLNGTNASDGTWLSGIAHLKQSITDILTTPLGSRVMRRNYGSNLFRLVDAPLNLQTIADMRTATVDAISRWEPRLQVQKVDIVSAAPGAVELDLTGIYLPEGKVVTLKGIVVK